MKISKFNFYHLFFVLLLLIVPYFLLLNSLPLYGDSTIHGKILYDILNKGVSFTDSIYPLTYFLFGAGFELLTGYSGIKIMVFLGLFLIGLFSYLVLKNVFGVKNHLLNLSAIFYVLYSPKLMFYVSRMYMEIFLSGITLGSIYFFFQLINKKTKKNIILFFLLSFLLITTKQQGVIVLFVFFLSFLIFNKKILLDKFFLFCFSVLLLLSSIAYLDLVKRTGQLIVGNEITTPINNFVSNLVGYQKKSDGNFKELDYLTEEINSRGHITAEKRHIWPIDVFTNFDKSNSVISLYKKTVAGITFFGDSYILFWFLIIVGFFDSYKNNKKIFFFSSLLLTINVLTFFRGNDQERYYLYLAIYFSFFMFFYLKKLFNAKQKSIFSIVFIFVIFFKNLTFYSYAKEFDQAISYRTFEGGIYEMIKASQWIEKNSTNKDKIIALSSNEWEFYSRRSTANDDRLYFEKNIDIINNYFLDKKIKYVVFPKNLIVNENEWNQFGNYTEHFYNLISKNYNLVYKNAFKNIEIYQVN